MRSDRFKKPPTLTRFARQLDACGLAPAGAVDLAVFAAPGDTSCYTLKALLRRSQEVTQDKWHSLFADILAELGDSPLVSALMRRAMRKGWALGVAGRDEALSDYFYTLDHDHKIIWLDHGGFTPQAIDRTPHCREALSGSFIRALRDIGHDMRLGAYEQALDPRAVVMMERARAADIEAVCVMAAWELRGAGYPGLWRHQLGSEDGDIALTFGCALEKSPAGLYDGKALAAAFLRWYDDPMRLNACDHATLEMLDELMAEHDGEHWGKLAFTPEDARDLSILPDGMAYLKDEAQTVAAEPAYHAIPDAINEAHLAQIAHDAAAVRVAGVPFRSAALARLIFPTVG